MNTDRLKFRVWDTLLDKYIAAYLVWCELSTSHFIVEQCTGLKDRNGKLIYDGDVLEKTDEASCYNTDDCSDFRIYQERKEKGLIVEETENKFNEIIYCFRTGETDIATMDRFPCYWLRKEEFGWEGEDLENPEDWVIIGNVHEMEVEKMNICDYCSHEQTCTNKPVATTKCKDFEDKPKMTNGDKIRQMSNEELAEYLSSTDVNACMKDRDYCKEETWKCDKCWLEWLNNEVGSE